MEQEALDRRLVDVDEAKQLISKALEPVIQSLRILPKTFSVRIVNASVRHIETILTDEVNRILAMARENVGRYNRALESKPWHRPFCGDSRVEESN